MKFSLISATSIIALAAAAVGPGHAAQILSASNQSNLYDLVHDGMTSADGGDRTVAKEDPLILAVSALEAAIVGRQTVTSTGPVDLGTAPAVPRVPLAAAPGTRPDDDFATPIAGAWQWNTTQKAAVIGFTRIAPLIGTAGNSAVASEKASGTVFVAEGSRPGFIDSGDTDAGVRSSSVAVAFAPSSTSTATITVAGAGNRQRGGNGYAVTANSLQAAPPASVPVPAAVVLTDAAQPTLGYNYAPAMSTTKGSAVEASFSDVVTATGNFAQSYAPVKIQTSELQSGPGQPGRVVNGKIQTSELQTGQGQPGQNGAGKIETSQLQPGRGQPGQNGTGKIETSQLQPGRGQPGEAATGKLQTSELGSRGARPDQTQISDLAARYSRAIDLTQPIDGKTSITQVDGTRTFLSASVSAHPSSTAALYMANVVNAARSVAAGQTVEAFQVGPPSGSRAGAVSGTSVSDPLRGKIMASAGALNNSLALP